MDLRTGAAFWPLKNGLIGVYPPLQRSETCDVAVIGAGVSGALVAQRLAEAGCDVVVVDRSDVAMGSTAATTGLLQYETDTSLSELAAHFGIDRAVRSWKLGQRAIDDIEALCSADGCGLTRRPSLYLASSRWDQRSLKVVRASVERARGDATSMRARSSSLVRRQCSDSRRSCETLTDRTS